MTRMQPETVHDPEAVSVLEPDQCWALLRRQQVGHLAFMLAGEPGITPVNYVVDDAGATPRLLFRTAEGSKLLAVAMGDAVAFEADEIGHTRAATVVVHGHVRVLHGAEEEAAERLPLHPWVPTLKYNLLAIEPSEVTGRRFRLVKDVPEQR